ncbi:hypothetical protein CDL15_Pgr016615 [Punica granatum]|uniref:Uncharacterized protein n=1 Tax=Punica granatum TaxID=22663 RepID=A0A218XUV0_PUNGR|nr:hypothetical protein CDL15_Pgr016615 [Punica granatum]PKI48081.1 hypothetical protein CRG98_031525 [Punica granatum]
MKALLILFLVLILVSETLKGADARSWLGVKERQLSHKVNKGNAAAPVDEQRSTTTPTTATSTSSSTTSIASSMKANSSPTGSSTNTKAGSTSTANGNQLDESNGDDFWDDPSRGQTHHVCLDYNHPKKCV